jgi:competence protein ComEA
MLFSLPWEQHPLFVRRLSSLNHTCQPVLCPLRYHDVDATRASRLPNRNGENHMIKKLMLAVATLVATMGFAFAQVDVNKADAAALDSVKGVGPAMSKKIIDERTKNGDFKDWADFQKRVKGVGDKNAKKLSTAGLQVNGQSKEGSPMSATPSETKSTKSAKASKTEAKKPADSKAAM